jgi:hypothetical protein
MACGWRHQLRVVWIAPRDVQSVTLGKHSVEDRGRSAMDLCKLHEPPLVVAYVPQPSVVQCWGHRGKYLRADGRIEKVGGCSSVAIQTYAY